MNTHPSTNGAPAIEIEGLSKRYVLGDPQLRMPRFRSFLQRRIEGEALKTEDDGKEIWALRDISLNVPPGTILGIIGANGAGKSTLLKVLSRVTPPTAGRAKLRGRLVSLLELGAGFHQDLTGRENIFLNAALYGIPRADVEQRLDQIIEFAELERFMDAPIKRYSSGMYLRLAFSVAINLEPDILLADEVLAVGDAVFQERCLQRVEQEGEAGLTVLFVSHDMAAVRRLCDQAIWLNAGEIVAQGSPNEVISSYEEAAWNRIGSSSGEPLHEASEHAEIVDVRLLGADGSELGGARVTEEARLQVRFRIKTPGIGFRALFAVRAEGVDVFRSVQPDETIAEEPGVYSATAIVPPHLLADIVYSVKASVKLNVEGERDRVTRENALTFRAYDPLDEESARGSWEGALRGVVRPLLEWQVEPVSDALAQAGAPAGADPGPS